MQFERNNLDRAGSPYLRQHKDNPVWWQEWSAEVLHYARVTDKPLFVSVGYSTCHWCHVMAADTFSDLDCADFLNKHFVSIKIDREQRPDIDQYLMSFLVSTAGSGGWPLNAFLSPELTPFYAVTYLGARPQFGRPGFVDVGKQVVSFYRENRASLVEADVVAPVAEQRQGSAPDDAAIAGVADAIRRQLDETYGGFGISQKFPPHSTLLYLLADDAARQNEGSRKAAIDTLDVIARGGLHDHLQGGFFRYCVDRSWTIPHFEKLLYDQAMLLWVFSLAADLYGREDYRCVTRGILTCLDESFYADGAYVSGHDADTNHVEGGTYVFSHSELWGFLSQDERSVLSEAFDLRPEGNFEGKIHLVGNSTSGCANPAVRRVSDRLLEFRRRLPQPAVDRKVITSWNCLTGVALIEAGRRLNDPTLFRRAEEIERFLLTHHVKDGSVAHSSIGETVQTEEFLEDPASFLLFETYLLEERQFGPPGDWEQTEMRCRWLGERIESYRQGAQWLEARNEDFRPVYAEHFDAPTPASPSLVELGKARLAVLQGHESDTFDAHAADLEPVELWAPLVNDFHNLSALLVSGYVHQVHSPSGIPYEQLPVNTIQVRGPQPLSCYRGTCTRNIPRRTG